MKPVYLFASALLISTVLSVSACSSKKKHAPPPEPAPVAAPAAAPSGSTATTGQQLIDLNQAREAGAITDEEYEAAKKRLLDSQ